MPKETTVFFLSSHISENEPVMTIWGRFIAHVQETCEICQPTVSSSKLTFLCMRLFKEIKEDFAGMGQARS